MDPYFGEYKQVYVTFLALVELLPFSEVTWVIGDFIIALVSILLRRYYEALHQQLLRSHDDRSNTQRQLEQLRQAQLAISALGQKVAKVFSPLILITVGFNVTYILAFLYSGLEEDLSSPSILVRFVFTFSFIYLVLRMTFSTYMAIRLTDMVYNTNNYAPFIIQPNYANELFQPGKTLDYLFSRPSLVGCNSDQQRSRLIKVHIKFQSAP